MKAKRGKGSKDISVSLVKEPSTPIFYNQNSNSCSNDTNSSNISSSNQNSQKQNPIFLNEAKIRNLLKELQTYVKYCQKEREKNDTNLTLINKTHEKLKTEEKITSFYKKKLKSIYATSLKESESEINYLRQALDCINKIRLTQNEIRFLQHNNLISSKTNNPFSLINSNNSMLNDQSIKINVTMRRGVLMSILQQAALTLPLWVGEIGQSPPPLCGSIPSEQNYICKQGDKVAAIVKNNNTLTTTSLNSNSSSSSSKKSKNITLLDEEIEEENWILAEVVNYNPNTGKYDVDDVDAEDGQERYTLSKKKVVPLPLWRANPLTDPEAIFPKDSLVLALYPQTTCFYKGIISESPQTPQEDYLILFEDNTYPEGYSPPLNVPQLYVVADRCQKNKS